jgi:hypothetical protein
MLWLALLACRHAAPEPPAGDAALRAWPFDGCVVTPTGPGLAFHCEGGPWAGIHEQVGTPEQALETMVSAMLEQGDGVERLRVDLGGRPATIVHIRSTPHGDQPETDLIVGAVEARPGMARVLIGEALPDDAPGRARAVYLMEYLAANGAPDLEKLVATPWEPPRFGDRPVPVPRGCLPGSGPAQSVSCLGESLIWSDLGPDADPAEAMGRGEAANALLGGVEWTFEPASCTVGGAPADACRRGRARPDNPLLPTDLLVGARRDGERTWLVFCGYFGPEEPAFCRELIAER